MVMETNISQVRETNERRVLQEVFNAGPISRSQISRNLRLNKVTVSDIVASLINKKYLVETGFGTSSKSGGRKPTFVSFNKRLGNVAAFEMGYETLKYLLTSIEGKALYHQEFAVKSLGIRQRLAIIQKCFEEANRSQSVPVLGLAIAIHGIVDQNQVLYTPFVELEGLDLVYELETRLNVPVVLENEANLSAIYERDFENYNNVGNLVCISIHKGIGAGIIIKNQLYTGHHGEAGEIGQTTVYDPKVNDDNLPRTIESICSEDSMVNQIRQQKADFQLSRSDIVNMYRDGDAVTQKVINNACFYIANILYNTIVTLDPTRVSINSPLIRELPELLDQITNAVPHVTGERTKIDLIENVDDATLLGGCSKIIHHILDLRSGVLNFNGKKN